MTDNEQRAECMKEHVGQAPYGTTDYFRNAAKVLSQWVNPDGTVRGDTRRKLEDLTNSSDPETRRIASQALQGHSYVPDAWGDDSDDDSDDD